MIETAAGHEIPLGEPGEITAGDLITWRRQEADYLPVDGWALTYALVLEGATSALVQWTASDAGDGTHLVSVTAATTAAYTPGTYRWQAYVTQAAERYTVGEGVITILADFSAQAAGLDARSHTKKVLDALKAMLEEKATRDQMQYSIAGRQLLRMERKELTDWHARYESRYAQELAALRRKAGQGSGRHMRARFRQ